MKQIFLVGTKKCVHPIQSFRLKSSATVIVCLLSGCLITCSYSKRVVTGEMYLTTRGGDVKKLAGIEVKVSMKGKDKLLKTTTDSNGRFEITLPRGSFLVFAETTIEGPFYPGSGTIYPHLYSWMFPFEVSESRQSLTLNNSNLFP